MLTTLSLAKRERKTIQKSVEIKTLQQLYWETVIRGKFRLLDWYWLLEEEYETSDVFNIIESNIADTLKECTKEYIKNNVISFVTGLANEQIVQLFMLIKKYPTPLKQDLIETTLPTTEIDRFTKGWPEVIYHPNFRLPKRVETDTSVKSPLNLAVFTNSLAKNRDLITTSLLSKKGSKKKTYSLIECVRKTTRKFTRKKSFAEKSVGNLSTVVEPVKKKMAQEVQPEKYIDDKAKKTAEKNLEKLETTRQELNPKVVEQAMDSSKKITKMPLPLTNSVEKTSLQQEKQTYLSPTIAFDRLDSSHFLTTRTKTAYVIKDVESVKDQKSTVMKRPAMLHKARVEKSRDVRDQNKSSLGATQLMSGNIFTMPPVNETMTNLGGGVIVRKDFSYKRRLGEASVHGPGHVEEPKPSLKPISVARVRPRITVSQLLDVDTPPEQN